MKLGNPWAFGLLFLMAAFYLMYTDFKLPTLFLGKTNIKQGIIVKSNYRPALRGQGYQQVARYNYVVNDSIYAGIYRFATGAHGSGIGNTVSVQYQVSDPTTHKVLQISTEHLANDIMLYRCAIPNGFEEVQLVNNVCFKREISPTHKLLDEALFLVSRQGDTLSMKPLFSDSSLSSPNKFIQQQKTLQRLADSAVFSLAFRKTNTLIAPHTLP